MALLPKGKETALSLRDHYGGHSMVAPLRRVLTCSPRSAGWFAPEQIGCWRELGYLRKLEPAAAQAQHEALERELQAAGVEVLRIGPADGGSLDAIYIHDASFVTDYGAVCLRMGKSCRAAEPRHHCEFYATLGIPIFGEIEAPGTIEAGDIVWLDPSTLLVGRGYRTNAAGIEQLRTLLASRGVKVVAAPLPHGTGPGGCLHLMSLISLLDEHTALVDLPWLAVETTELLRARHIDLIEIDPIERASLACNVLALGDRRLLAFEENSKTCSRLRKHGFEVKTIPGAAIGINGGGGPTCLTRPLFRG